MKLSRLLIIIALLAFAAVMVVLVVLRMNEDVIPQPSVEPEEHIDRDPPRQLEDFTFTETNFPRMNGSPATVPLAQAVASVLLGESRESVADKTMFTRTTQAFRDLVAGHSDILIVSEPSPGVFNEMDHQGFSIDMAPIALDALVFITSTSNPVESLTTAQLNDIYSGNITNWRQVGGDDVEITAFQRNEEAGSQIVMQKLVMDWQTMANPPMQSFSAGFDEEEFFSAIKGFDGSAGAIGYTMLYSAEKMKMAEGLKIISVDGVAPSNDTIISGEYPLLNPYYVAIDATEPEDGAIRIMFNWLLSRVGQDLINEEGYVSVALSGQAGSVPIEMAWNVLIDDSKLTEFVPPHILHSRLSGNHMPELVPSDTYGLILPYSSAITMNDGNLRVSKYGFVTIDGVVITDLIYDDIQRVSRSSGDSNEERSVYHLQVNSQQSEEEAFDGIQTLNAAAAIDGRWITEIEYVDIVFSDDVIFLMRDHESFDIDVYSYGGQQLYNIMELEWAEEISEDTWSEPLVYGASEGFGFIKLNNDKYALMDVFTGEIEKTEFIQAFSFSDGLAAVVPEDGESLWGFVNKDLEIVIEPAFAHETAFINGLAVVETPDSRQHIIDKEGEEKFVVESEHFIIQNLDGNGFSVHAKEDWEVPRFYTNDFEEIRHPTDEGLLGPESNIQYVGDGWYFCMTEVGTWLFTHDDAFMIPPDRHLVDFLDGYIIYNEFDENFTIVSYGVMLQDGTDIIYPSEITSITPAVSNATISAFIRNTNTMHSLFVREIYTSMLYTLVDVDGSILATGPGILSYHEDVGMYSVQGTDFFSWLDRQGNTMISLPSMAYSFD